MPSYAEILAALPDFRNDLLRRQQTESVTPALAAFAARGAFSAFATPLSNVHAVGAGVRQRGGEYDPSELVIKLFVFDKVDANAVGPAAVREWKGLPVDVEHLPIQVIRPTRAAPAEPPRAGRAAVNGPQAGLPLQRERTRPIVGGVSIAPIDAQFVGTLGCFLRGQRVDGDVTFALSNNHVLADTNRLPRGTRMVQPGPESSPLTPPADVFATLSGAIRIRFPVNPEAPVVNRFDAAVALVTNLDLVRTGTIFGGVAYDPSQVVTPTPGMRVIKAGRTTGVTRGVVTATNVDGVQVNYGTQQLPRIAVFDDTIEIAAVQQGQAFSLPGDSGSVILEEQTGHPVALLFAGDGVHTTACALGPLCRRLRAWPV